MSTIASPRQSLTLSSRRDSTSTDNTTRSVSTSRAPANGSLRRNRAALRDYYGLKAAQQEAEAPSDLFQQETEKESVLDIAGFDANKYVKDLLASEGLEGILRTEATLISDTRNLDGEKKSLVYDNYSKLIAATETIRKMRTNMDPLTPTTSTLTPAIEHIAEAATALSGSLKRQDTSIGNVTAAQQETVSWVIGAPQRLQEMTHSGDRVGAEAEWQIVKSLLDKWKGVDGVQSVRAACLEAIKEKT